MLEVCSTTLPQTVIPAIFSDSRYKPYLKERAKKYSKKADIAYKIFSKVSGIVAPKPEGAFYMSIVFEDGVLTDKQTLPIENSEVKKYIEDSVKGISPDKRFAYYLMGATGICVVPLSGFNSELLGFRVTLLEVDEAKFNDTVERIAGAIKTYLKS